MRWATFDPKFWREVERVCLLVDPRLALRAVASSGSIASGKAEGSRTLALPGCTAW